MRSIMGRTGRFHQHEDHCYFVPDHMETVFQAWTNLPEPIGYDNNEDEWDAWESTPEGIIEVDNPWIYRVTVIG